MIGTKHVSKTLVAALAVVIALATGCGVDNPAETAAVSIDSVTTGCTDLAELVGFTDNLGNGPVSLEEVRASAEGAARVEAAFEDGPEAVRRFTALLRETFVATIQAAEDRDDLTDEQLPLLLELEFASREAEGARVAEAATVYLEAQCGDLSAAVQDSADQVAFGGQDGVLNPTVVPTPTPAPTPTPLPVLVEETGSDGAAGRYQLVEIEVEGITRTNMDAESVLQTGTGTPSEDEIVLVGVRLTSSGAQVRFDLSAFQWVDAQGNSTAAVAAYDNGGAQWAPSVEANESRQGWLVFPASVGATNGAMLRVVRGSGVPENLELGQGAAESPYPLQLEIGQTGSGVHNEGSNSCRYPFDLDVNDALITLDRVSRGTVVRAEGSERWLNLNVSLLVTGVEGPSCAPATTTYLNLWELRLRLDNGDIVAPFYFEGNAKVGATFRTDITFPISDGVGSFELLDDEGTILATWTDVSLPTP